MANLVGPDGRDYVIDEADKATYADRLKSAMARGYRPVSEAAPKTTIEKVKGAASAVAEPLAAGAVGGVQGLTAGLFGASLRGNQAARQGLEEQKQAHPIASVVGELGGALVNPINEVAAPFEAAKGAGLAARIGGKVAGNAAVGSLFGAGNMLSDAALGDQDLTAEKLIAGPGMGALLGGGLGGMMGAVGETASAILPKVGRAIEDAQQPLKEFADKRWLRAGGAMDADIKKIPEWKVPLVADAIEKHVGVSGDIPKGLESMEAEHEELGKRIGELVRSADEGRAPLELHPENYLKDANPLELKAVKGKLADLSDALQENQIKGGGFEGAHKIISTFGKDANWKRVLDDEPIRNAMMKDLYRDVRADFESQLAPHLGSDAAKEFLDVNSRYGALSTAAGIAQKAALKGSHVGGIGDIGAVIAGGGGVHGLGLAIGRRIANQYGPGVAAKLADQIASSPALMSMASSFAKQIPQASQWLGEYAGPLAQAASRGPQHALAQHMVMAAARPDYQQKAVAAGFTPENSEQHQAALMKAHGIAQMAAAAKEHDDEVDRHVDKVFKGGRAPESSAPTTQDFGAKRMRLDSLEGHNKRVDEIRQLAADPQALLERTTKNLGNLANIAPGVSGGMTRVASTAMQYLAAQAQTPPKAGPLAPDYVPSEAERYSFAKKLEAVEEPLSVMRHAAAGTLTQEQVDALKAVYPSLYADISNRLLTKAVSVKSMPYQQVLMVGLLTGTDLDGTTSDAAIASNQATIRANSQKPGQPGVTPPSSHGSSKNSLAARTASPTDRLGTSEAS